MIVVSDTSPVNYLVLIELQDLLHKLFDRVLISDAVHRELQSIGAPEPIKRFLDEFPDWLAVQSSPDISPALRHLDAGEREAIALALAIGADLVLLDERKLSPMRPWTLIGGDTSHSSHAAKHVLITWRRRR